MVCATSPGGAGAGEGPGGGDGDGGGGGGGGDGGGGNGGGDDGGGGGDDASADPGGNGVDGELDRVPATGGEAGGWLRHSAEEDGQLPIKESTIGPHDAWPVMAESGVAPGVVSCIDAMMLTGSAQTQQVRPEAVMQPDPSDGIIPDTMEDAKIGSEGGGIRTRTGSAGARQASFLRGRGRLDLLSPHGIVAGTACPELRHSWGSWSR